MFDYPFTEEEARQARDDWGLNCGPAALAFACQIPLDAVRDAIPGFATKRYTSPTMMQAGLRNLGRAWAAAAAANRATLIMCPGVHLVRVQWGGPWTAPGANPKWAYRQTHWIATFGGGNVFDLNAVNVFDVNGGVRTLAEWEAEIVPAILATIPRASGDFWPTHIWRLT